MKEIEYVGHVISSEGIKFSEAAKSKTLDFAIPKTTGQFKQFVGMAEYFHSHVRNFATLARPLHKLLHGYSKKTHNQKLDMSDKDIAAFKAFSTIVLSSTR